MAITTFAVFAIPNIYDNGGLSGSDSGLYAAPPVYEDTTWDTYEGYTYGSDYMYNGYNYAYAYSHDNGGYIGYAPGYYEAYGYPSQDYTYPYYAYPYDGYSGQINITVDYDYSVDVWPSHLEYTTSVVICSDITIPVKLMGVDYTADIGIYLPYGWTYTISHGVTDVATPLEICPDGEIIHEMIVAKPYVYVRILPLVQSPPTTGIMPFIAGADRVVTVFSNPGGTDGLLEAINAAPMNALPGDDFIISVNADITFTQGLTIAGGRRIILASHDTDLATNTGGIRRTLTNATAVRHFTVSGSSTLTLSNIVLDGVNRYNYGGGVTVTGVGSNLFVEHNTIIQENRFGGPSGSGAAVDVAEGATFTMNGGIIRYNRASVANHSGGVGVRTGTSVNNSRFIMNGGEISHNLAMGGTGAYHVPGPHVGSAIGGGVTVNGLSARFYMFGGDIIHNTSVSRMSGGVDIRAGGRFYMHYGTIAYNVSSSIFIGGTGGGGGVALLNDTSVFTMYGGYIRNNIAWGQGGGIRIRQGTVNMRGGVVHDNFAGWRGGGGVANTRVGTENMPTFNFYGGIIRDNRAANVNRHLQGANVEPNIFPHGGGVQVDTGHFNVRGPDPKYIIDNHTTHNGGGINWNVGTMTIAANVDTLHVTGNSAGIHGGGIYIGGHGFVVQEGFFINNNTSRQNGGGIFLRGGNFNMTGGQVNNNGQLGDGIIVAPNNRDYIFVPNSVETQRGGGVHVSGGNFIMTNGSIGSNNATISGGGAYVTGGSFTMHTGSINGNQAFGTTIAQGGGGVFVSGGNFTMVGLAVKNINNNTALNGGGIFVSAGGNFTIGPGGNVNNNNTPTTGTARGVGVFMGGGIINMTGGNISGNTANTSPSYGGGVFISGPTSVFNMSSGIIGGTGVAGNSATIGGGVWVGGGATFNMRDYTPSGGGQAIPGTGQVIGNTATGTATMGEGGGGVFIIGGFGTGVGFSPTVFNLTAGIVENNQADRGGGVKLAGGARLNMAPGTSISGNRAYGITTNAFDDSTGGGGGVFAIGAHDSLNPTTFTMTGGQIARNRSRTSGGIGGGAGVHLVNDGNNRPVFNMSGGVIGGDSPADRNYFTTSSSTGAGVHMRHATFNMSGTARISFNDTNQDQTPANNQGGGGISISGTLTEGPGETFTSTANLNISENAIIERNGSGHGGGIHMLGSGAIVNMTGGTIAYNMTNPSGAGGGGVYMSNGRFYMSGGVIRDHALPRFIGASPPAGNPFIPHGAGVRMNSGRFIMSGSAEIKDNTAGRRGGGILVMGGTLEMRSGTITRNTASGVPDGFGNGGGVHVEGSTANFIMGAPPLTPGGPGNPLIDDNTSAASGGGVHLQSGASFTMYYGIISNNTTTQQNVVTSGGGGVYLVDNNTTFVMRGGEIHNNITGDEILPGNNVLPNVTSRGAGVHVAREAQFDMHNGAIRHNNTRGMGGGVNVSEDGVFYMHNGFIHHNRSRSGAGVYLEGTSTRAGTFVMHNGEIHNNWAIGRYDIAGDFVAYGVGGGVHIQDGVFTMHNGVIHSNDANWHGGGVFVRNEESSSELIMYGGTIGGDTGYANTAVYGGGVYLAAGDVTFNLRGEAPKHITGNIAEYDGGGVWIATNAHMQMETTSEEPVAGNLHITNNIAGYMGGGIFTDDHGNYPNPLLYNPITDIALHFQNLILMSDTVFTGNTASFSATPPVNALPPNDYTIILPNIGFDSTSPSLPNLGYYHPLNNHDINFRTVNTRFEFLKTDHRLYNNPPIIHLLEGAHFKLFRAPIASVNAGTGLVITDASGAPNAPWQEVPAASLVRMISTGNANQPITFYMTPGFVYQLVEYLAPVGFMHPGGQWRLQQAVVGVVTVETIAGVIPTPGFVNIPCTCPNSDTEDCQRPVSWLVGNMPEFELPLAGGTGSGVFTALGVSILAVAVVALALIIAKKRIAV